jgi:hypothetical protein
MMAASFGKEPDDISAALHFLARVFNRIGALKLSAVQAGGGGHVGQHVVFAVGLFEGLPNCGADAMNAWRRICVQQAVSHCITL